MSVEQFGSFGANGGDICKRFHAADVSARKIFGRKLNQSLFVLFRVFWACVAACAVQNATKVISLKPLALIGPCTGTVQLQPRPSGTLARLCQDERDGDTLCDGGGGGEEAAMACASSSYVIIDVSDHRRSRSVLLSSLCTHCAYHTSSTTLHFSRCGCPIQHQHQRTTHVHVDVVSSMPVQRAA